MKPLLSRIVLACMLALSLSASVQPAYASGAEHTYYTGDDDGDGVPNWRDPMNGEEANPSYVLFSIGAHAFNLLVLFGVLGYFARRPVQDFLKSRALAVRTELTDAAKARDDAEQRHREVTARLNALQDEIDAMMANAKRDAELEHTRLMERAQAEAQRLDEAATRALRDQLARAKQSLHDEAVDLAVQLAEQALRERVGSAQHQALAREFLDSVKQNEVSHG